MTALYVLSKFKAPGEEVPLEDFLLFSLDYTLEKAKSRFPNNTWNGYPGQSWNKKTKSFDVTEHCIWSTTVENHIVLIRKI